MVENLKNNSTVCLSNELTFALRYKSNYMFPLINYPSKDKNYISILLQLHLMSL